MANIGIDLDGICSRFTEDLRHFANTVKGHSLAEMLGGEHNDPGAVWDHPVHKWGWSPDTFLAYCNEGVDAGIIHLHSDPYEGTSEALQELRERGHTIHIITARSFGQRSPHNTADWLHKHDIPYDSLMFTHHKHLVRVDLHLDDSGKHFKAMWAHGTPCLLWDRPWNQDVDTISYRIDSWDQFLDRVEVMCKDV